MYVVGIVGLGVFFLDASSTYNFLPLILLLILYQKLLRPRTVHWKKLGFSLMAMALRSLQFLQHKSVLLVVKRMKNHFTCISEIESRPCHIRVKRIVYYTDNPCFTISFFFYLFGFHLGSFLLNITSCQLLYLLLELKSRKLVNLLEVPNPFRWNSLVVVTSIIMRTIVPVAILFCFGECQQNRPSHLKLEELHVLP